MARGRNEILEDLAREEARLAELERTREAARSRIASLRAEIDAVPTVAPVPLAPHGKAPLSPADKVQLFRSLFRGRDDVYPTRFVSKTTGKTGYAPACANEWVRGVCDEAGGKCGDCPNQAFVPVSDQIIIDHLQGRHVMGVYPLLDDETCWFLAVDFDKRSWMEDVAAFVETCRAVGVPAAVERSRSGNGAHVWFFFAAPVPATSPARWAAT